MKALITGGAGFIGSHLGQRLLEQGWDVVVVDDLSNGFESNVPAGAEFIRGDAADAAMLDRACSGCSAIFHLAAVSSVQDSLARPLQVHGVNLTMTLALLEAAVRHDISKFVFSSSAAVYGDTLGQPAREDMVPAPLSHYAVQKLASEYYCGVYRRLHGIDAVCLRYFNVYGPGQRDDSPYSGVISKFLAAARKGEPMNICGDGAQTRDFVHVSDVVEANLASLRPPVEPADRRIYNIGSGASVSVVELADMIRQSRPCSGPPLFAPARAGEIKHSRADITRARTALGFMPRATLSDFLKTPAPFVGGNL